MTEEDLKDLMDACKPVLLMNISDNSRPSTLQNVERGWKLLSKKMGFNHMSARPIQGKNNRYFSALANEPIQKQDAITTERPDHSLEVPYGRSILSPLPNNGE